MPTDPEDKELESADDPEEGSEGTLSVDPELEAALREAADAVDGENGSAAPPRREEEMVLEDVLIPEPPPSSLDGDSEAVERLSSELVEAKDQMLRLQADFDNFRRRALKEHREAVQYGHQNLVKDLLSAVDNLQRAIHHSRDNEGGDLGSLLQGVELVEKELVAALKKHGVEAVEAHGKPFDPALHEAMAQTPDASVAPNTVIDVYQEGYQLRERLIRPARVVVAKAPDGTTEGGAGD